jgi:hypothetical protein
MPLDLETIYPVILRGTNPPQAEGVAPPQMLRSLRSLSMICRVLR